MKISNWEKIAGLFFGVAFIAMLSVISIYIPEPTPTQYAVFKTILALCAAAIGGILAGTIEVNGTAQKWKVKAGGALALFVIVFFFTPMPVNVEKKNISVKQNIEKGGTGIQHTGKGNINIRQ